jgi:hypothetical protein
MPTLNVRDVPKPVYERVRRLARQDKRSLSQQVLWILEDYLKKDRRRRSEMEAWQGAELLREKVRVTLAPLSTQEMVRLIREDRDR